MHSRPIPSLPTLPPPPARLRRLPPRPRGPVIHSVPPQTASMHPCVSALVTGMHTDTAMAAASWPLHQIPSLPNSSSSRTLQPIIAVAAEPASFSPSALRQPLRAPGPPRPRPASHLPPLHPRGTRPRVWKDFDWSDWPTDPTDLPIRRVQGVCPYPISRCTRSPPGSSVGRSVVCFLCTKKTPYREKQRVVVGRVLNDR